MELNKNVTLAPMDNQTLQWLETCILTAPDSYSLEGIRVTIEWFYSIDKDMDSFNYLLNKIIEKERLYK
jgi:hypothetical protein